MANEMTVVQKKALSIRDYINGPDVKKQLLAALPKWLEADRFLRTFYSALMRNPVLLDCSQSSMLSAMIEMASLGLEPILGKAALVPYQGQVQFQPMYRGLIELAKRSGNISRVTAHVVYKNDIFDVEFGTQERLIHKPFLTGDRGNAIGAYAVWWYKDGDTSPDFMSREEIELIRNRSQGYLRALREPKNEKAQRTPWVTDPEEMAKKTVIKRSSKLQDCSIEFQRVVEIDNAIESGGHLERNPLLMDILPETPEVLLDRPAAYTDEDWTRFTDGLDLNALGEFIAHVCDLNEALPDTVKADAIREEARFKEAFNRWLENRKPAPPTDRCDEIQKMRKGQAIENLNPSNLSTAERQVLFARYKHLYGEPHPSQAPPPEPTSEEGKEMPDQAPPVGNTFTGFIPCPKSGNRLPVGRCVSCDRVGKCQVYAEYKMEHGE